MLTQAGMLPQLVAKRTVDRIIAFVAADAITRRHQKVFTRGWNHFCAVDRYKQGPTEVVELQGAANEVRWQIAVNLAVQCEVNPVWKIAGIVILLEQKEPVRKA